VEGELVGEAERVHRYRAGGRRACSEVTAFAAALPLALVGAMTAITGCNSASRSGSTPEEEAALRSIRTNLRKETVPPSTTLAEQRKAWIEHARTQPLSPGTSAVAEVIDGVPCLWVRSDEGGDDRTVVYLHGGGLVDGSALTHRELASRLARTTRHAVLLVDYRLLPEHPPEAPSQDAIRVYRSVLRSRGADPRQLAFGGDSSGGAVALAALMALRDAGDPLPARVFMISAALDATLSGPTLVSLSEQDPILSHAVLKDWQARYLPPAHLASVSLSPLFGDLSGLPPMLLQVGSDEVWLSDSTRLAERLRQAGGAVTLRVWSGLWHVWPMEARLPHAQAALEEIAAFLRE
jgi:epsilon-lactone hydrolase